MNRILIVISLCVLFSNTSCTTKKEHHEEVATYPVTNPVRMDTIITETYVCQIQSIQHIELRAQERGYLEKIYVDEGQFVKEGQLLFKIMPRLYEAEMQRAKAEVNFAEIEYTNTKRLADSNIVAPNELALAKAKFDKAKAELALTQVHLGFTEIRAPFDGIIDRFHVRQGSLIDEGDLLTHLSDNRNMWVYYNVPEAEYLDYITNINRESNKEVRLLMANNRVFQHPGKVETVEADFNPETGNIPFRATFPNPDGILRHGETGSILMDVPLENSLIIPQKATYEILDKNFVYVLDDENQINAREITVGAELEDLFVVSSGLTENDKILLEGLRKVKEKEKISYEFLKPMLVISQLKLPAE